MAEIRDLREERGDYLIAEALETIADRIRNDDEFNPDTVVLAYTKASGSQGTAHRSRRSG